MAAKLTKQQHKRQMRIMDMQRRAFWCADGTMLERLIVGCKLAGFTPAERFVGKIIDEPQPWQIVSVVFCESDSERYFKALHFEKRGKIKELQPEVNKLTDKLIAEQNHNHFVSWGWWATPAGNIDLDSEEDSVVEQFEKWGAWNRDLCAIQLKMRMEKSDVQ